VILEALEYLLTPCSRAARAMGYLGEAMGIRGRYRRCRRAWQPHLERTRNLLSRAMHSCHSRRKAVILGSGPLYDVPLEQFAAMFREVILVDLVHPLSARWRRRRLRNVRSLRADVTGTIDAVHRAVRTPGAPLPAPRAELFLHDPEVDLIASVNLLSQLPFIPSDYLDQAGYPQEQIHAFSAALIRSHLAYLEQFAATTVLVTDVEVLTIDRDGRVIERSDLLSGVELPYRGETWIWDLAPRPESHPVYSYSRRVVGVLDIRQSAPTE
jgi:hypothetical protein